MQVLTCYRDDCKRLLAKVVAGQESSLALAGNGTASVHREQLARRSF